MSTIPLTGGLILNRGQGQVHPGSLQECLNWEAGLSEGYGPVQGFQRFDGRPLPVVASEGLTNSQYDAALKAAWDAYRADVGKVPGIDPMAVKFFRDQSWVVTHSETYAYATPDALVSSIGGIQAFQQATIDNNQVDGVIVHSDGTDTFEVVWMNRPEAVSGYAIRFLSRVEFDQGLNVPESGTLADGAMEVTVRAREIRGGDSAAGTAEGILWVQYHSTAPANGTVLTGGTASVRVLATRGVSANTDSETTALNQPIEQVRRGVLVHTTPSGWEVHDMGFQVDFKNGAEAFFSVYSARAQIEDEINIVALPGFSAGKTTTPDPSLPDFPDDIPHKLATNNTFENKETNWFRNTEALTGAQNLAENTAGEYVYTPLTSDASVVSTVLSLRNLTAAGLPDDAAERTVTGIELELSVSRAILTGGAPAEYKLHSIRLQRPGGETSTNKAPATIISSDTPATITIGGAQDLWGLSGLSLADLQSNDFRVMVQAAGVGASADECEVRIHRARLVIHQRTVTAQVVVRRGTADIGTLTVLYADYASGRVADGDAAGTISVSKMVNMSGVEVPFSTLADGDNIYGAVDGGGGLIATIDGVASRLRLPIRTDLNSRESKYQFIDTNFFGVEFLDAVYGVSGAGPAFTFNDKYFFFIRTGAPEPFNNPRHVAKSKSRLVLGYETGIGEASAAGEPDNFSAIDGAFDFGIGEKIMGIVELPGDALALIARRSIQVFLEGQIQSISPNAGAIEYSVSNTDILFFCDQWGVATIEAVQQYGDFGARPLSEAIAPMIQPRLQGEAGRELKHVAVTRSKSQYQMYFADGVIITLTMKREGPQFTIQTYWHDAEKTHRAVTAIDSGIALNGQERQFMLLEGSPYLYERNVGNSFDGQEISGRCVLNAFVAGEESRNKRFNNLHIHGRAETSPVFQTRAAGDYELPNGQARTLPINKDDDPYISGGRPFFVKTTHNVEAMNVALAFEYAADDASPFTLQSYEWPEMSPRKVER